MEEPTGSPINRIIGMGVKTDKATGRTESISLSDPSYIRHVIMAFEHYPITKYFGLTIKDAMNLPVDQWHQIRRSAAVLAEKPDTETRLLEVIKELVALQRGVDVDVGT